MESLSLVTGWPVDRAAVGVAGFAAPDGPPGRRPPEVLGTVGSVDRVFAWASVTKMASALAVLIAVEEGSLRLDEELGPSGSTVRHLLAHASGLGPEPGPPRAPPGVARIYSNAGFQLLGQLVARRSQMSFPDYLRDAVLDPLGLAATGLDPDDPAGPAASGLQGPIGDLMGLAGEWAVPTLVDAGTHRDAIAVQFTGLDGVLPGFQRFEPCDWGLGVEIRGHKRPHWTGAANSPSTFGHFGRSGSFVWIDPEAGLACAGLSDRPFGSWAVRSWPVLADAVIEETGARSRPHWAPRLG